MRDKKRIKNFCDELATIWESKCPDWRFGQMICNIFGEMVASEKRDPFFPEEGTAPGQKNGGKDLLCRDPFHPDDGDRIGHDLPDGPDPGSLLVDGYRGVRGLLQTAEHLLHAHLRP